MANDVWTTKASQEIKVSDMETSHIKNTIAYLKRNMPDHEENEHIVADHWSLDSVVVILGSDNYNEWINVFEKELDNRNN